MSLDITCVYMLRNLISEDVAVEVVKAMEIDKCEGRATSMVGSGEESRLFQTWHGFDDHDYSVVKYSSPAFWTAIEEQMLAFEVGFDIEKAMESSLQFEME